MLEFRRVVYYIIVLILSYIPQMMFRIYNISDVLLTIKISGVTIIVITIVSAILFVAGLYMSLSKNTIDKYSIIFTYIIVGIALTLFWYIVISNGFAFEITYSSNLIATALGLLIGIFGSFLVNCFVTQFCMDDVISNRRTIVRNRLATPKK